MPLSRRTEQSNQATNRRAWPIRIGVFDTVEEAHRAVDGLLRAGFTRDEVTVICSDETQQRLFPKDLAETAPGRGTASHIAAGAGIGAALGGFVGLVAVSAIPRVSVVAAGALAAQAGALVETFAGAMVERGMIKEMADHYDQAVARGKILAGVDLSHPEVNQSLTRAERVFEEAGAKPVPLPKS